MTALAAIDPTAVLAKVKDVIRASAAYGESKAKGESGEPWDGITDNLSRELFRLLHGREPTVEEWTAFWE